jgi:hypothetical protein
LFWFSKEYAVLSGKWTKHWWTKYETDGEIYLGYILLKEEWAYWIVFLLSYIPLQQSYEVVYWNQVVLPSIGKCNGLRALEHYTYTT